MVNLQLRTIPGGDSGIWASVSAIAQGIRTEKVLPIVRVFAAQIVNGCGPLEAACRARAILGWVRNNMRFTPDPEGVETVMLPSFQLQHYRDRGWTFGDCDDGAALIGALDAAIGLPVRLRVASFIPDGRFHHIWTEVRVGKKWVEQDPFRAERFNQRMTRTAAMEVRP